MSDRNELIKLWAGAHALDRIHQAYRDNSLNDAQLVNVIGERLREVYGPVQRADTSVSNAGETCGHGTWLKSCREPHGVIRGSLPAEVAALAFASRGTVTSKGMTRYAERYTDGSVTVHTSRTVREATKAEADTYRAD